MVQDKPIDPTSVNAVVRLLELADPEALKFVLTSKQQQLQCMKIQSVNVAYYLQSVPLQ